LHGQCHRHRPSFRQLALLRCARDLRGRPRCIRPEGRRRLHPAECVETENVGGKTQAELSTSTLANVPVFRSRWRCPSLPSPRIGRDRGPCVRPPPAVPAPPPERSACAVLLPLATRAAPLEADRCGGRRARYRSFCSRLRARLVPLLGKSAFIEYAPPV